MGTNLKRYDYDPGDVMALEESCMIESDEGEYVKYKDIENIESNNNGKT